MNLDAAFARAAELDSNDRLAHVRGQFDIPAGVLYFDGNSLGPLTHGARKVLTHTIEHEWRERLIRSWNEDWLAMPLRVGNKIAPLIGAPTDTVVACDNTSINLHKALMAAVALRIGRTEIVIDSNNFPTDIYIAQSVANQCNMKLIAVPAHELVDAISERTAVVTATHVDYRSAQLLDVVGITTAAHSHGALMVWDLAHTAGAVPFDVSNHGIDFAVGCGYKYLNGGPGASAFIYVAPNLLQESSQPLQGWFAHSDPFGFETGFRPASGIARFLTGTPNVLSMKGLDASLDVFAHLNMVHIREKSVSLTSLFVELALEHLVPRGFTIESPLQPEDRGSHVALGFAGGKALVDAMSAEGIVADFRPPDLMRFGFAPLYNTHHEVVQLVKRLLTP